MYSLKNLFTQSPEKVKATILSVLGVGLAFFTDVDPSLLETVGVGIAIERILDLFYVAPTQRANEEDKALKAIDLGKKLARPNRPLHVPDVGNVPHPDA